MKPKHISHLAVATSLLMMLASGCEQQAEADPVIELTASATSTDQQDSPEDSAPPHPEDAPIEQHRIDLLNLGFGSASAMPAIPHLKDRSRVQEEFVNFALEMNQPELAMFYANQIANWREGTAIAACALYFIDHGYADAAAALLVQAEQEASVAEDWRRDRIRAQIARALIRLGRTEDAAELELDLDESMVGIINEARFQTMSQPNLDAHLSAIDEAVTVADFDVLRHQLFGATSAYDRFYEDVATRSRIRDKIVDSWDPLPFLIRIDLLESLANIALEHGDQETATELIDFSTSITEGIEWNAEFEVPVRARLASLRHRAGDTPTARKIADDALVLFESNSKTISSVFHAQTLIPLAEAYAQMGDSAKALSTYGIALDSGESNPNGRVRAMTLASVCGSMARVGVRPTTEVDARLRRMNAGLEAPW